MTRFKTIALFSTMALLCGCDRTNDSAGAAAQPVVGSKATDAPLSFAAMAPAAAGALEVSCAIDKINAQPAAGRVINVEAGRRIRFSGWVSDPARQVPGIFTIVLAGPTTYGVTGMAGISRPDVARALDSEALVDAGFNVSATLGPVAVGEYAVHIIEDGNGKPAKCTTNTRVAVVKPTD